MGYYNIHIFNVKINSGNLTFPMCIKTYIKSNTAVTTRLRQLINKNPWEQEHKKGQKQGSQKQDSQKRTAKNRAAKNGHGHT